MAFNDRSPRQAIWSCWRHRPRSASVAARRRPWSSAIRPAFSAGGLIVPAKTPDAVVARLQKACADAVASDGYKSATEKLNATARYLPEAEFKAMFAADSVRNAEAVKKAGIAQ